MVAPVVTHANVEITVHVPRLQAKDHVEQKDVYVGNLANAEQTAHVIQ